MVIFIELIKSNTKKNTHARLFCSGIHQPAKGSVPSKSTTDPTGGGQARENHLPYYRIDLYYEIINLYLRNINYSVVFLTCVMVTCSVWEGCPFSFREIVCGMYILNSGSVSQTYLSPPPDFAFFSKVNSNTSSLIFLNF